LETSEIAYRVADFLKLYAPFQAVDLNDLLALAAHGRVRFHERHEFVLWQGEPHRAHVFVIQQGTVSLWDESDGRSQLRDVRGAGDMLGIERYTGARAVLYTARAESDVVLYAFAADDFETSILKYPRAEQYVTAEKRSATDYQPGAREARRTFLHDLVGRRPLVTCRLDDPLALAADRLRASSADALAVVDVEGRMVGALTAATILQWAADGGGDARASLRQLQIEIAPPPAVAPDASLSDGVLAMGSAAIDALAVTTDGTPQAHLQALVTARDLAPHFGDHPLVLLAAARSAASTAELADINQRTRAFVSAQLDDPSGVEWLARMVHLIDRAIFARIVRLTEGEEPLGCWCFAGPAGRAELLTKVAPHPVLVVQAASERAPALAAYLRVVDALTTSGYLPPAAGNFEPEWFVATSSEWASRFRGWIDDPVRQQMYRARALFDLQPVLGPLVLWEQIDAAVRAAANRDFVRLLANDCLATLPPLTFFQDAVVDREGEHLSTFHLELSALQPLVDVGRVFGIATGACLGRSTLERFAAARARMPEHQALFRDAADALRVVLMQQARVGISEGTNGSDLPPSLISSYDRRVLKGGFGSILRLIEFTDNPAWLDAI
jgi:CBS domain-containing protein